MRIQSLTFDFFGQFSDKSFDFGQSKKSSDFHIIYGPNEAGKTTTMEGYLRLLYGFPLQDPYSFLHQRSNLRVSGRLDFDGVAHHFTRITARNGNLIDQSGTVLPERTIGSQLDGLSLDQYRKLLCLDDETIEKGGNDIASGSGEIGRLLFSAAAGVADLNAVLEQAKDETDSIYKKGGRKHEVAELKSKLSEIENEIKEADINASAWRKLKDAANTAKTDVDKIKASREDLLIKSSQNASLLRVLPKIAAIDRLIDETTKYKDYPSALNITDDELVSLKTKQATTEADLRRSSEVIETLKKEKDKLIIDDEKLALNDRLKILENLHIRTQSAKNDLPRRAEELENTENDMAQIGIDLGFTENGDVTTLVKSVSDIKSLETLRDQMKRTVETKERVQEDVEQFEKRIEKVEKQHQLLLEKAPHQNPVGTLLSRFDINKLSVEFNTAEESIASANGDLADKLANLRVGDTIFVEVPTSPIGHTEIEGLSKKYTNLNEALKNATETAMRYREEVNVTTAQINQLEKEISHINDEASKLAHDNRDHLWKVHMNQINLETAKAFETSMKEVDNIDALRISNARELGELRQFKKKLVKDQTLLAEVQRNIEQIRSDSQKIQTHVNELVAEVGLTELTPPQFADWLALCDTAKTVKQNRERVKKQHQNTMDKADKLLNALLPFVGLETQSFHEVLEAARGLADEERKHNAELDNSSDNKKNLEEELEDLREKLFNCKTAVNTAQKNWKSEVQNIFGDVLSDQVLIESLTELTEIRAKNGKRQALDRQVVGMQKDNAQFSKQIETLRTEFNIDEHDPNRAYRSLQKMAQKAQDDKHRFEELEAKIKEEQTAKNTRELDIQEVDLQITKLSTIFPNSASVNTLDTLHTAIKIGAEVIKKRENIDALETEVFTELSVKTIDEAREMIGNETASSLTAKQELLKTDLDTEEKRLHQVIEIRVTAENELNSLTNGVEMANLVEKKTTLQLELEESLLRYIKKDFGLRLAAEAIRRYRDKHRGDMMSSTERAFSELTNGAYQKLLAQPDGASDILVAVDRNGTAKQIGDMSKGTRFQLYLALRAAAYEQMVKQGLTLPFFCDDVFETFDEDRTIAACRLMERIGKSGQAIYLTHHRHVIDLAKECCADKPMVHEI